MLKCRIVSSNPRAYGKVHAAVMIDGRLTARCAVVSMRRKRYRKPAYDWMKVTCKRCLSISDEAREELVRRERLQRAAARILDSRVYLSWADALCQLPGANAIELMKAHLDDFIYVAQHGRRPQYGIFMRVQGEARDDYRMRLTDLRRRTGVIRWTIGGLAEVLDQERIAYTRDDLRALRNYLNGRQTAGEYDALTVWARVCADTVLQREKEA